MIKLHNQDKKLRGRKKGQRKNAAQGIILKMRAPRDEDVLYPSTITEARNEVDFFLTSSGYSSPEERDWSIVRMDHSGEILHTLVHSDPEVEITIVERTKGQ